MTKFSKKAFQAASAQALMAAHKIDTVIAAGQSIKSSWAAQCVLGFQAGKITIEDIRNQLLDDYRLNVLTGEAQAEFDPAEVSNFKATVGSTINGWYHDIKNVLIKADTGQLSQLVRGEVSLSDLRRALPAVQEQKNVVKAKPKVAGERKPVSFADAVSALSYHVDTAMHDNDMAKAMASNPALAELIAKLAKLEKRVSANLNVKSQAVRTGKPRGPRSSIVVSSEKKLKVA